MNNTKCLTEQDLMAYMEGRLSVGKRSKVEQHLSSCDTCLDVLSVSGELDRNNDLYKMDPVPEEVTRKALNTVLSISESTLLHKASGYLNLLVSKCKEALSNLWLLGSPALAPVRGDTKVITDDLILLKRSFLDLNAEIEIEKKDENMALIKVWVTKDGSPIKNIRITLLENGREVASHFLNGAPAIFEDIPFSRYVLRFARFTRNGAKIREYPFEIKETRND
jgi:hypothetical protein